MDKITAVGTYTIIPYLAFVNAWIVPLWADQLLPQLLMDQFGTLPIHCRHIEYMHEGVYNFFCSDSTEIFFSKLRSAGLNSYLPSFFTDLLCGGYLISIAY